MIYNGNMAEIDEQLYARFLKYHDDEALKILLERHRESLTLFILGIVHNLEDAEDIMMDSFAVLLSDSPRFKGKSSFKTWLFSIGRNLALKHLRKYGKPHSHEEEIPETKDHLPEVGLIKDEEKLLLYRAIDSLGPEYRQVISLIYFYDMSIEEVATVMKKNKKQIYNLSSRGKKALKETLSNMGFKYGDL